MTKSDRYAELLWERFILQDQVYVEQWRGLEKSGYRKIVTPQGADVPLTMDEVIKHVKGNITLGIYQLKNDQVKTLCIDLDSQNREAVQYMCARIVNLIEGIFGEDSYVIEDSGSKGYHVWMFFSPPANAEDAYRLGRWLVGQIEPEADVGIEVFPKQMSTTGYGNLVKLPWGTQLKTGNRCIFVSNDFKNNFNQYDKLLHVRPLNGDKVGGWLDKKGVIFENAFEFESGPKYLCMNNVMANGAIEGHRDIAFHKLACHLYNSGLPQSLAEQILEDTNERSHPPANPRDAQLKVQGAYRMGYASSLCMEPGLDIYCSPDCAFFARKAEKRGVTVEHLRKVVGGNTN